MSRKRDTIEFAKSEAAIDAYGDEGAGYSMKVFVEQLELRGWRYKRSLDTMIEKDTPPAVRGMTE